MSFLLDTHALLWFFNGDQRLPPQVISLITENKSPILISHATLWEIAIKMSIGKLKLDITFEQLIVASMQSGFRLLPLTIKDIMVVLDLPFHHRDPFDRMLVAQAIGSDVTIITTDNYIPQYPVKTFWQ